MKLIFTITICILGLRVECQSYYDQQYKQKYEQIGQQYQQLGQQYQQLGQQYKQQYSDIGQQYKQQYSQIGQQYRDQYGQQNQPQNDQPIINDINPSVQFRFNVPENGQVTDRYNYQGTPSNPYLSTQQFQNVQQTARYDDRIHFLESNEQKTNSTPFGENSSANYYSTQQNIAGVAPLTTQVQNLPTVEYQAAADADTIQNLMSSAVSNFGLNLIKIASQLKPGNVIISPTSIATMLALLQQGATGEAERQISNTLNMGPEESKKYFGPIAANLTKYSRMLSFANGIFVSDNFNLDSSFKQVAIRNFFSDVTPVNFARTAPATLQMNQWIASKTNYKIQNLLTPGSVSPATQLVLLNAVYFKGLWATKFKPERTQTDTFYLSDGQKKPAQFMYMRHLFKAGYDPKTGAVVTILPFEGEQYSLVLILPKKADNVNNVLSTLTAEQLLHYQTFNENEVTLHIPKFTLKTETDLTPVLRTMGITNIFGAQSELSKIGMYRNNPPQISQAVHSGYLSIDEQGVTAAAATGFVAIALSYDDSTITFRADRPFLAIVWDNQLSIPIFISKIENPS